MPKANSVRRLYTQETYKTHTHTRINISHTQENIYNEIYVKYLNFAVLPVTA